MNGTNDVVVLHGLQKRPELNGLQVLVLGSELAGRVPVRLASGECILVKPETFRAVTASDSDQGAPAPAPSPATDEAAQVFGDTSLALSIVQQMEDFRDLARAACVNRPFAHAVASDEVWRDLCQKLWQEKWGFRKRWARAMESVVEGGWRERYRLEAIDSIRTCIEPGELQRLVFDFRMWIGGRVQGGYQESGIRHSNSRKVQFCAKSGNTACWEGRLHGHPNGDEEGIEWVLDHDGVGIQWGYWPHPWPKGRVYRLPSWGWEIRNPNVILRAIDDDCGDMTCDDDTLFEDLLASLTLSNIQHPHYGQMRIEVPERCCQS